MKAKKIVISVIVVLAVAAYALYYRFGRVAQPVLVNNNQEDAASSTIKDVGYKDGEYAGAEVDSLYGKVQVSAVIKGGKLVDINFLEYPKDQLTSKSISESSMPKLKTEAIAAQSADVDTVSAATQTSEGFKESLASALAKAKV